MAPAFAKPDDHSASTVALVEKVIPTVVSIRTLRSLPTPANDPVQASAAPSVLAADGSGFIVDPSGYIATNRHVVDGAYEIGVTFFDGRHVEAKVAWKSLVADVAFLKVEVGQPLQAATLASNLDLKLGQRVIAIGNPLGLGISVSTGVVSALNRNIKQSPYDDFIQTDAAINHGSSGGPLFDEFGAVVGMNTALYASVANGGSEGLGFAIPGADLSFLIDQLKRNGRIRCGWLGVLGQKMTPEMADASGFPKPFGVIVASMTDASPAMHAGLRRGDIIETLDSKVLYDVTTLNRAVCRALGKTVSLKVWRDGRSLTIDTPLAEVTDAASHPPNMPVAPPRFASASDLGLEVAPMSDDLRRRYRLAPELTGLVVTAVAASSKADVAGLRAGDVLVSMQMTPLSADKPFDAMIADYAKTNRHHVIVLVQSSGGERWITLPISPHPAAAP